MAPESSLIISGPEDKHLSGHLNNFGLTTWTDTGSIIAENRSTFNNEAGATFDAQNDTRFTAGFAQGAFNNNGTFQKSAGTETTTIEMPFTNRDMPDSPDSDLVSVLSGTLNFTGTFTQSAGRTTLQGGPSPGPPRPSSAAPSTALGTSPPTSTTAAPLPPAARTAPASWSFTATTPKPTPARSSSTSAALTWGPTSAC
jgi:hypothetical protein